MPNVKYKKTETVTMKVVGVLDINENSVTVSIDDDEKNLATLLSDFVDEYVEISIKTKDEEELDHPSSDNK